MAPASGAESGQGPAATELFPCTAREIALIRRLRSLVKAGEVDRIVFDVPQFAIIEKHSTRVEYLDKPRPLAPAANVT